jgi:DNA-binding transcriptional LysR family regulator
MDQLRALRVFAAVVEQGSFAAAADHLGLSRTAASKHVQDLEARLGIALLHRTTRSVSLTQTGAAYFERARRVLDEIELADSEASLQTRTPRGRLRASVPVSFGFRHLAPRLKGFMDRYPDVHLDLIVSDRQMNLVEEGFDLAIRIGELADSSLIARRIAASRLILCAAPGYLDANGWPAEPRDLSAHLCLGYPYWSGHQNWMFTDRDGSAHKVPVKNQLWSNNGDLLLATAVSGCGIIRQPDFIVHEALASGELVELLPDLAKPEIGIHAVYPPAAVIPLRLRVFIDYLVEAFSGEPPWAGS